MPKYASPSFFRASERLATALLTETLGGLQAGAVEEIAHVTAEGGAVGAARREAATADSVTP